MAQVEMVCIEMNLTFALERTAGEVGLSREAGIIGIHAVEAAQAAVRAAGGVVLHTGSGTLSRGREEIPEPVLEEARHGR